MDKGNFITFEGIDGSGKTSLIKAIAHELVAQGLDVLTTQEPGGTQLGMRLREVFLRVQSEEEISPLAEALLFAADRAQHVECLIKPALKAGKIIISDRFTDSTLAYQGAGRNLPLKLLEQLINIASGGLTPDLTILLDLPVQTAILRKQNQGIQVNRMDTEKAEFYERVRKAYLELAARNPERFRIVSADKPFDEVKKETLNFIWDFLGSQKGYYSISKNKPEISL
jgi:dTMP kinase